MDDVDDTGPNVELDEIDVELDDGTALILGEELIDGVRVGDIVTVGPTLPTSMTLLEGGFDDVVGPMLLLLVEGTLVVSSCSSTSRGQRHKGPTTNRPFDDLATAGKYSQHHHPSLGIQMQHSVHWK